MSRPVVVALIVYAAAVTVAAGVLAASVAAQEDRTRVGHLVVERLDIVEPDGTPRLILYGKARDPQILVRGQTYRHPSRTQSGMLFFNDEGTEVGGLVVAGARDEDGGTTSGGSLTFDAYEQDQIVQLMGYEQDGSGMAGLFVSDRPAAPMNFAAVDALARAETEEDRNAALEALAAEDGGASRAFFGRNGDEDATVVLRDAEGRTRLRLAVAPDGDAVIEFLNSEGEVVRRLTEAP